MLEWLYYCKLKQNKTKQENQSKVQKLIQGWEQKQKFKFMHLSFETPTPLQINMGHGWSFARALTLFLAQGSEGLTHFSPLLSLWGGGLEHFSPFPCQRSQGLVYFSLLPCWAGRWEPSNKYPTILETCCFCRWKVQKICWIYLLWMPICCFYF